MSEILIPNVDLPKKEGDATYLRIDSYGHVFQYDHRTIEMRTIAKVVELPPHGRLIDEADLRDRAYKRQIRDRISFHDALALALIDAPTIIEASKERE